MERADKNEVELPEALAGDAELKWRQCLSGMNAVGRKIPEDAAMAAAFTRVFAFSDFVSGVCIRHPETPADLIESGDLKRRYAAREHHAILEAALAHMPPPTPGGVFPSPDCQGILREVRRREMVRIAFRDLAGWADLSETMAELSLFADACLAHTLQRLYSWHCLQHGTPTGSDGTPQQLVILAMGKLGALELNFSSDIDLIFAYPDAGETKGGKAAISNAEFFARLGREIMKILGAATADGIVFRVDTNLRPFGESGPLAMSFDAMEAYYQTQGREWERYAWVKARAAAGDILAGELLLKELKPFVYRRYLDFGVFESLREMKRKISLDVQKKKMAGNIKLGAGGIREIEFFGQMFQLIRGGVVPDLQERSIQKVLGILAEKGFISRDECTVLLAAYLFLRRTENRLQAFADRQTHHLPTDPGQQARIAASMGFDDWDGFCRQLDNHMTAVHEHFNRLLESGDADESGVTADAGLADVWLEATEPETAAKMLVEIGFTAPDGATAALDNLRNAVSTRALSMDGRKKLDLLMPLVLKAVGRADHPVPTLNRIIELIKTIEQRTSYLALLLENPATLSQLVKFSDASPWIISYIAKHPVLLDELLDPRTLYQPPEKEALKSAVWQRPAPVQTNDLELFIEELCIFKQINTLRVAAADVAGHLPLMKVSDRLSWIAEAILDRVLAFAWNELVEKHGTPECGSESDPYGWGFTVVAYGKLGGLELGYASDLDLVFLHAGAGGTTYGGPRIIDTGQFFARLGQRMVHILTAHTRAGKLYDTDMRLRPSGSSGPLVSQIDAFKDYQVNQAWTWENQAMVRARAVCGDPALALHFDTLRKDVLSRLRHRETLQEEVVAMRERLRKETLKPEPGVFHLKQGRGAMVDIEFIAQYLVLLNASTHPELTRWSDNVRILESLTESGVIDNDMAFLLKRAYLSYRATAHRLSLREQEAKIPDDRFLDLRQGVEEIWRDLMVSS